MYARRVVAVIRPSSTLDAVVKWWRSCCTWAADSQPAFRLDLPAGVRWFDLDVPDVIDLRRLYRSPIGA
jgi:hypothetical protein